MAAVTLADSKSTIATDPLRNFKFWVNIAKSGLEDMIRIGFMSAGGLGVTNDVIPYREGGNNTTTRKLPGQTSFTDVTLARGLAMQSPSSHAWRWFTEMFYVTQGGGRAPAGNNFRTDFDIWILDHPVTSGPTPLKGRFRVYNAWISGLAYSDLDAGGNGVMIEQMTLTHEGFDTALAGPGAGESL